MYIANVVVDSDVLHADDAFEVRLLRHECIIQVHREHRATLPFCITRLAQYVHTIV